jgi:hypothetical protein
VSDIIPEPNEDFSHNYFEYCYVFLGQKLTILEYISKYSIRNALIRNNLSKKVGPLLVKIRCGVPVCGVRKAEMIS